MSDSADRSVEESASAQVEAENVVGESAPVSEQDEEKLPHIIINVATPCDETVSLGPVSLMENTISLKQGLSEFFETCCYTNYVLEYRPKGSARIVLNEYAELSAYFAECAEQSITLRMVLQDYDVKSARAHVKRTREILSMPPQAKGMQVVPEAEPTTAASCETNETDKVQSAEEKKKAYIERIKDSLPSDNDIFTSSSVSLEDYYKNVLYRVSQSTEVISTLVHSSPADFIKSVISSGWNPPPPARRLRGDLFYIEVHLQGSSNTVVHITAQTNGFFVNNSTMHVFDPTPAPVANFSHELLHTLFGTFPVLLSNWETTSDNIDNAICAMRKFQQNVDDDETLLTAPANALESIAAFYSNEKSGGTVLPASVWTALPLEKREEGSSPGKRTYKGDVPNSYSMSRAQDDLGDSFGLEEKGVLREWNEEIQAIRQLPVKDINEHLMKARYAQRIIQEFVEACRSTVIAITQGHIAAVNLMDAEEGRVYVFNNIFFSRAVDMKDTFKVFEGNDATRKSAGQDVNSQKLINALGIEGLHTGLSTVVDYRGDRWMCQSVIPGVLQTNEHSARLMYGVMEDGTRLSCKTQAMEIMRSLGDKLAMVERTVPSNPPALPGSKKDNSRELQNAMIGFLGAADNAQSQMIRIDAEDEVCPADSETVPHIGPIEGKLLKGSDGRIYVLEMTRLTPRDANYVSGEKGTGNIAGELLVHTNTNVCATYVIRDELIRSFRSTRTQALKQGEMVKAIEAMTARREEEKKKKELVDKESEATGEKKEEAVASKEGEAADEMESLFTPEDLQRIKDIQVEVSVNPNCFLHTPCDVDPEVVKKDEDVARELANFLWSQAIPYLSESIRLGESMPVDGRALTEFMHSAGVNMRYLGKLASLAAAEESIDFENAKKSQKRKNPMPYYWRELLEVEIAARTMKHLINTTLASNKAYHAAPANVLSLLLNHLLGSGKSTISLTVEESVSLIQNKKTGEKKKKGKKGSSSAHIAFKVAENMPTCAVFNMTKEEFWGKYSAIALEKFLHGENALISSSSVFLKGSQDPFVVLPRVSKLAILRRVCQLTGIRILCRDYNFNSPAPFGDSDVQDVVPLVKSCEPSAPVPEASFFLEEAKGFFQQGLLGAAYERAQDASRYVSQVVGGVHKDVSLALGIISQVLLQIGDAKSAIPSLIKKLTIDAQLHGLDSHEILQSHLALSAAYQEIGNHLAASEHLQSAVFIMKLCCGEHHPEMPNIFLRLASMYQETGHHDLSMKCLMVAKELVNRNGDQGTFALICQMMSGIFAEQDNFKDAIALQKQSYAISRQLYGEGEPRTADCKSRLEVLLRVSTEKAQQQLAEKADRDSADKKKSSSMWLDDDFGAKVSKTKKSKKNKKK